MIMLKFQRSMVLMAIGFATFISCSKQIEGERCNILNKSDDCESGLICTKIDRQDGWLCCPSDPNTATIAECKNRSALNVTSTTLADAGDNDSSVKDSDTN